MPGQLDTDFISKELPYILCYVHTCLVSAFSRHPIAKNMADALKLYVIASRGFAARLNRIDTADQLSTTHERESIRRDMTDFCEAAEDSAPIAASLFYSLTELCRSINAGEIHTSNIRNGADWTKTEGYLSVQNPPVDLDTYRDTICQFMWCYVQRKLGILTTSALALTNTTTTAQTSNAPPASAPVPEPSHAESSEAPTPRRNLTHRVWMEGYQS